MLTLLRITTKTKRIRREWSTSHVTAALAMIYDLDAVVLEIHAPPAVHAIDAAPVSPANTRPLSIGKASALSETSPYWRF